MDVLCPEIVGGAGFSFVLGSAVPGSHPCRWTFALGTRKRAVQAGDRDLSDARAGLMTVPRVERVSAIREAERREQWAGASPFTGWAKTHVAVSKGQLV